MTILRALYTSALVLCTAGIAVADDTNQDPLFQALAGKTFFGRSDVTITLHTDGRMTGGNDQMQIVGTWEVKDGQYCRTITEPTPEPLRGTGCPEVTIEGDTVTFTREDGTARSYQMR